MVYELNGNINMVFLEIINTVLVIIGVVLITIPKIHGLYIMIFAQIGWIIFSYLENHWFFFLQSIFLLIFNFVGIYNWRRKHVGM